MRTIFPIFYAFFYFLFFKKFIFFFLQSTKIHIGRLTRNVNKDHLQVLMLSLPNLCHAFFRSWTFLQSLLSQEIFATFGEIKEIEFGSERQRPWLNKGFAYIEYKTHTDALNAMKHMDGGQIDGQVL